MLQNMAIAVAIAGPVGVFMLVMFLLYLKETKRDPRNPRW